MHHLGAAATSTGGNLRCLPAGQDRHPVPYGLKPWIPVRAINQHMSYWSTCSVPSYGSSSVRWRMSSVIPAAAANSIAPEPCVNPSQKQILGTTIQGTYPLHSCQPSAFAAAQNCAGQHLSPTFARLTAYLCQSAHTMEAGSQENSSPSFRRSPRRWHHYPCLDLECKRSQRHRHHHKKCCVHFSCLELSFCFSTAKATLIIIHCTQVQRMGHR